jgi:hypothetical protein
MSQHLSMRLNILNLRGVPMKVKSVLFSEMRNKLGNQIVGTGWKGRMVFRAYKKPANPKTCSQLANRDHTDKVLKLYQTNVGGDPDKKALWDIDALPRAISGYNLFMMLGRSSRIDIQDEHDGTGVLTGHYTVTKDISTQGIYAHSVPTGNYYEAKAIGTLVAGTDVEFVFDHHALPDNTDDFEFFIVDGRSKTIPPTTGDPEACHNGWSMDETVECEAVPAYCTYVEP